MLVLTRKRGETIRIDGPCEIEIVQIDRGKVRIGITADKSVLILRGELEEPPPGTQQPDRR